MIDPALASDMIRRVAILAPMRSELAPLVKPFGLRRAHGRDHDFHWGAAGTTEVVASLTGMGLQAGTRAAECILDETSPDHLVIVGIAGGIGERVSIGDLVIPQHVLNLDTGDQFEPVPLRGMTPRGTLASSDVLLESPEQAEVLRAQGVIAIDMETAAVAEVCERRGCPWSVLRGVSDRADDGTTDAAILGLADSDGNPNPAAVTRFVLSRPHRIPQLVRLARGASAATRAVADAAFSALRTD